MSEKKEMRSADASPAADVDQSRRKFVTEAGKLAYRAPIAIAFSLALSNEAAASHLLCPPPGPIEIPCDPETFGH
jgi:hypothetical protein